MRYVAARRLIAASIAAAVCLPLWVWAQAGTKPESLGFSSGGLEKLHQAMQHEVDQRSLAGIVTLLMRHGKLVEERSYGVSDVTSGAPMKDDAIFRIFSMTKPVTGVAMMILYEQGKWRPSDPISKFIPEFADLKVYKGVDASGAIITEAPAHPPTMAELMTHTAGFTYGAFGSTPVDRLYGSKRILASPDLHEMIQRLAGIPLLYQPGTKWVYSVSMDIQGYVVEKLTGKSLPEFMQERIFGPLRMRDTGFFVPKEKRARFATGYGASISKEGVTGEGVGPRADYVSQPGAAMGGSGLVSTAEDYARFAQMLLNRGQLDGLRILSPASVAMMTANHLADSLRTGEFSIGRQSMRAGHGWGYDLAVFDDPVAAHDVVGKGTFYWEGLADTWFWVDPANDIVFVGMTQRTAGAKPAMDQLSRTPVYAALTDPKK